MTSVRTLGFAFAAMGNKMVLYGKSTPKIVKTRMVWRKRKAVVVVAIFAFSFLFSGIANTALSSNDLNQQTIDQIDATDRIPLMAQIKEADSRKTKQSGSVTGHNQKDTTTETKDDRKGASPGQKSEPLKR